MRHTQSSTHPSKHRRIRSNFEVDSRCGSEQRASKLQSCLPSGLLLLLCANNLSKAEWRSVSVP
eukprot:3216738-Amphidinium_carterae.1